MIPVNQKLLVELTQEEGVLKIISDEYLVVKVVRLCDIPNDNRIKEHIKVGSEILVDFIKDYLVNNKKYYFVPLDAVIAVL